MSDLDRLVLNNFPYPIATLYHRLRQAPTPEKRVVLAIRIFEHLVRYLALIVVCDYLETGDEEVRDQGFTDLLLRELPKPPSIGAWVSILFAGIEAFGGQRAPFFLKELFDLCWDANQSPPQPRQDVRSRFHRLAMERSYFAHGAPPDDEAEWQAEETRILPQVMDLLGLLRFIARYNPIQVTGKGADTFQYTLWKGQQVATLEAPLPRCKLHPGHFYLTRDLRAFLRLDPLIVPEEMSGMGLYDGFSQTRAAYLAVEKLSTAEIALAATSAPVSPTVFVCYSRVDWPDYVRPLVDRLRAEGVAVWIDQRLLEGGQDWLDEINAALERCAVMVLCVSPEALASRYVKMEYRYFVDENKPIIPLICRETHLPAELRRIQFLPYADLDRLVEHLQKL